MPVRSSSGFAICADPTSALFEVELSKACRLAPAVLDRLGQCSSANPAHQFLSAPACADAVSNNYCPETAAFTVAVSTRTPMPMVDETATFFK